MVAPVQRAADLERPPTWEWGCLACGLAIRAASRWAPVCASEHEPRPMRRVWEEHWPEEIRRAEG